MPTNAEQAKCDPHHDAYACELRPHLEGATETDTTEDARFEQVRIGLSTFRPFKVDLLLDFLEFKHDKVIVLVAFAVKVSQNL
jgi:hypothetical protein